MSLLTKEQSKEIIEWRTNGSTFRRVAERFSNKYEKDFFAQDDGIAMVQEALVVLGRDAKECWDL
jgi:hypothetical protein